MSVAAAPVLEVLPDWGTGLPDLWHQDVSDIGVGPDDDVYLLYRDLSSVVVCAADGTVRATWGLDVIGPRAHGVTPSPTGDVFVVDDGRHCIHRFDPKGKHLATFGSGPSNPEFAAEIHGDYPSHVARSYPPFTKPTRLAVAPGGDLYISDGYGNCRVHRFTADGRLLASWGEPGTGPGQFNTVHAVYVDREGRVLVCDRENDRIQVFDADGKYLEEWTDVQRPQAVVQGQDGLYYVAESAWRKGYVSLRRGPVAESPSRLSILQRDGRPLQHIGGPVPGVPGSFVSAHGIAMDSRGDVYIAEVSWSALGKAPGAPASGCKAVQKFRRAG